MIYVVNGVRDLLRHCPKGAALKDERVSPVFLWEHSYLNGIIRQVRQGHAARHTNRDG